MLIASFGVPRLIRRVISTYRLDRADTKFSSLFRFHQAPWYYLLAGADFTISEAPDFIKVSAIVEVGKEAVLYVGVLDKFYVDDAGDRLGFSRRHLPGDRRVS